MSVFSLEVIVDCERVSVCCVVVCVVAMYCVVGIVPDVVVVLRVLFLPPNICFPVKLQVDVWQVLVFFESCEGTSVCFVVNCEVADSKLKVSCVVRTVCFVA